MVNDDINPATMNDWMVKSKAAGIEYKRGERFSEYVEKMTEFAKKDIPTEMDEFIFEGELWICQALVDAKLVNSTSQARRDIKANAVSVNQEKITNDKLNLQIGEYILQKGKKNFARIIIK